MAKLSSMLGGNYLKGADLGDRRVRLVIEDFDVEG